MQPKKHILGLILMFFLTFSSCINIVFAGFKLGDSSLPIDEDGFIEYDFEDKVATQKYKVKVEFVKLYQYEDIIRALGVNISVSKFNFDTTSYEVLNVNLIEFQNQLCLLYNKTDQFFRYGTYMDNLLMHGYGGYYVIPDDPVDINIVKVFIESYTAWSANVSDNTVTIDVANDQAILTYNDKGILIKEEIKSNSETISTLTIINPNRRSMDIVLIISLITVTALAAVLIPIGIIAYRRR